MSEMERELSARLDLVQRAVARTHEPLGSPLGIAFEPLDGARHLADWEEHAANVSAGTGRAAATLYLHVPFCARVCTYCLLSAMRVPSKEVVAAYVGAVRSQIAMHRPAARALRFGSVHIGGGTPSILDETQLATLLGDVLDLPLEEGAQVGIEAHPATATPGRLATMRRLGVHRVSFGVESMTPAVLRAVNREDQTEARVRAAVDEARRLGFAINVDLLAGLPAETDASWDETVRKAVELSPDSMSVNRFLGENSPLDRSGYGPDEVENARADRMLLRADTMIRALAPPRWPEEPLVRAGFGTQYVWERGTTARRYFQSDMIGPTSTLAFGHGALGHLYGRHFSITSGTLAQYIEALQRGEPPPMVASRVDERFEMAFFVAEQACRGELTLPLFRRAFGRELRLVFGREVDFLLARGMLAIRGDRLMKPPSSQFQIVSLLAFLTRDGAALRREAIALDESRRAAATESEGGLVLGEADDLEDAVTRATQGGSGVARIDVGAGLDAERATQLAHVAERRRVRLVVVGDARRTLAQYDAIREELPPSMLWVRIAIRASQSSRDAQRTA